MYIRIEEENISHQMYNKLTYLLYTILINNIVVVIYGIH